MTRTATFALLISSLAFAGCYGAAPGKLHPVPVPEAGHVEMIVNTNTSSYVETTHNSDGACLSAGLPVFGASACLSVDYDIDQTVTEVSTTAQLGDIPISYGQFLVLADPNYDKKLAELEAHTDACHRSALPEWLNHRS